MTRPRHWQIRLEDLQMAALWFAAIVCAAVTAWTFSGP
jgi:hypothetical protein